MHAHDTATDGHIHIPGRTARPRRRGRPGPASAHDRAAFEAALDYGLVAEEVDEILAGRRIVEAFPVQYAESLPAYAVRAASEMMVAYLR